VPLPVADLNGDAHLDALDLALVTAFATSSITCLPQFPAAATPFSLRMVAAAATLPNPTQYFFYTPEQNLLSHTDIHAGGGTPSIAVDYIWFAGMPVAQESLTTAATGYTFADHLGTPFLQTTTNGTPTWRADLEPYGEVWRLRTGNAADQRLRFPGQEYDEQTPERAYNIFRWYRGGWGRYTQPDPLGITTSLNVFAYTDGRPLSFSDPLGLLSVGSSCLDCKCKGKVFDAVKDFNNFFKPGWGTKQPKCKKALMMMAKKYKPAAPFDSYTPLTCASYFHKDMTVQCSKYDTGNFGGPPSPLFFNSKKVWLQPNACHQPPGDLVNTLLHEILHNCGAPDENLAKDKVAYEVADACFP
jgi:RHS repeat-associated protein